LPAAWDGDLVSAAPVRRDGRLVPGRHGEPRATSADAPPEVTCQSIPPAALTKTVSKPPPARAVMAGVVPVAMSLPGVGALPGLVR